MYQQNAQQQSQQVDLEDLDFANFVLSELKRSAREYTTAALEAANPGIRQTFETLLQKTLDDQALVFQEIQKLGGYQIQQAEQQMIEQELQKQSQTAIQVQSLVQQYVTKTSSSSYTQQERSSVPSTQSQTGAYQPYQEQSQQDQSQHQLPYENPAYNQQQQHNDVAALHQASTPSFQPVNYASQYPGAAYNNQPSRGYAPTQSQQPSSQQNSYNQPQGRSYQNQGQSQNYNTNPTPGYSSYGREPQGYAASSNQSMANNSVTGRPTQARIVSRNQPGMPSSNSQEGNKYNF